MSRAELSSVCRLEEESKASKELDRDLEDLKKILDSNKLTQEHLQQEMELLKTELAQQTKEHQAVRLRTPAEPLLLAPAEPQPFCPAGSGFSV